MTAGLPRLTENSLPYPEATRGDYKTNPPRGKNHANSKLIILNQQKADNVSIRSTSTMSSMSSLKSLLPKRKKGTEPKIREIVL